MRPKACKSLGFRVIKLFNSVMLAKHASRIYKNPMAVGPFLI